MHNLRHCYAHPYKSTTSLFSFVIFWFFIVSSIAVSSECHAIIKCKSLDQLRLIIIICLFLDDSSSFEVIRNQSLYSDSAAIIFLNFELDRFDWDGLSSCTKYDYVASKESSSSNRITYPILFTAHFGFHPSSSQPFLPSPITLHRHLVGIQSQRQRAPPYPSMLYQLLPSIEGLLAWCGL